MGVMVFLTRADSLTMSGGEAQARDMRPENARTSSWFEGIGEQLCQALAQPAAQTTRALYMATRLAWSLRG